MLPNLNDHPNLAQAHLERNPAAQRVAKTVLLLALLTVWACAPRYIRPVQRLESGETRGSMTVDAAMLPRVTGALNHGLGNGDVSAFIGGTLPSQIQVGGAGRLYLGHRSELGVSSQYRRYFGELGELYEPPQTNREVERWDRLYPFALDPAIWVTQARAYFRTASDSSFYWGVDGVLVLNGEAANFGKLTGTEAGVFVGLRGDTGAMEVGFAPVMYTARSGWLFAWELEEELFKQGVFFGWTTYF